MSRRFSSQGTRRGFTLVELLVVIAIIGAILFSLYAIAPPEGIDLGEESAQEERRDSLEEAGEIRTDMRLLKAAADELENDLSNSSHLDGQKTEEMKQRLDELNKLIEELQTEADGLSPQK